MLPGRLGLESARVPYVDRHGLMYLSRGNLAVRSGTLHFSTAGDGELSAGDYDIPFQRIALILLGPGTTVSHDAMRILTRHGTGVVWTGTDGVKMYASMPFGQDSSDLARRQMELWGDRNSRVEVARLLYGWRFGYVPDTTDLKALRGIEGARMKSMYAELSSAYGLEWKGRRYDRANPTGCDLPNQALNHASTAVQAAAMVAVAATATIPQLGFIHEDSSNAFVLDIADLYRTQFTIPIAFAAAKRHQSGDSAVGLEAEIRRIAGDQFRRQKLIPQMIESIKSLTDFADDGDSSSKHAAPL